LMTRTNSRPEIASGICDSCIRNGSGAAVPS
jgi:hypothetical protein